MTKRKHLALITIAWFGITITSATATSIVQTGDIVTGINGLLIDGNIYNVTFGTTIDTTFSSLSSAGDAANAIVSELNTETNAEEVTGGDFTATVCYFNAGSGECNGVLMENFGVLPSAWINNGATADRNVNVDLPAAEFALQAPEPGSIITALGLGILFLAAKRKGLLF